MFGFLVFFVLLLFSVQAIYHLYATSVVTGAAVDAARSVAGYDAVDDRTTAQVRADAVLRDRLGAYGREHVETSWTSGPDQVSLRIRTTHPSLFPSWFNEHLPFAGIDRTIDVRSEDVQ